MSNTEIWDALCKTDPAHTKGFKRGGGFSGTAVKPMYCIHRMTQQFGAAGHGWGYGEPKFEVVSAGQETLVFCTLRLWHGTPENVVYGVGGDKVVSLRQGNAFADDEAFKKAFTDALTNAMKHLGVAADVHMGLFDDSKYVNERRQEEAAKDAIPPEQIAAGIVQGIGKCDSLDALATYWRNVADDVKALPADQRKRVTTEKDRKKDAFTKAEMAATP